MPEIGLKLWSTNTGAYLDEATRLYNDRIIDYLELYSAPETSATISAWKRIAFPTVIHCAHSMHGFNLSRHDAAESNRKLFGEAVQFYRDLEADAIIVHPGTRGTIDVTIEQIKVLLDEFEIPPSRLWVENKPAITLADNPCVGSEPEEILLVLESCKVGFVLDVTHAIKYAVFRELNFMDVLGAFMEFSPSLLHVCDAHFGNSHDEHLHIGSADFDFSEIMSVCSAQRVSIETNKENAHNLRDFEKDVHELRRFFK